MTAREEYFKYLDDLQKSGIVNMFGAGEYLQRDWCLSRESAKKILIHWMETYNERHPK